VRDLKQEIEERRNLSNLSIAERKKNILTSILEVLPMTSAALNLAVNQASSPNWPLRMRPRAKSFGKPHTAETSEASQRLLLPATITFGCCSALYEEL